jgi:hypothetical protein
MNSIPSEPLETASKECIKNSGKKNPAENIPLETQDGDGRITLR